MPNLRKQPVPHLQIGGELPYAVVGYTQQFDDSPIEIVAIYGPVPSEQDADALKDSLGDITDQKLTVVPAYVVRPVMVTELPVEIDI